MKAGTVYTDAPQDKAVVYFTPTVNTTVYLRVYSLSGTLTAMLHQRLVIIQVLGQT
jgi:hypothetical protein